MTSGYNYGNLIKLIVFGERNSTNDAAITSEAIVGSTTGSETFLSGQRKIEVIKVRRESARRKQTRNEPQLRLFYPGPRELETTFRARTLLNYLVIKFFKKTTCVPARTTHFFRCKSLGKCSVEVMRQFAHCRNDVLQHYLNIAYRCTKYTVSQQSLSTWEQYYYQTWYRCHIM